MSRKLFIGAKVTIDEGSTYWNEDDRYNPRGIVGRVTEIAAESEDGGEIWWRVDWSNGHTNSYEHGDLKILGKFIEVSKDE